MNEYFTHQPHLLDELKLIENNSLIKIIEIGVGEGSSSILNQFAKTHKTIITAYDNNYNWFEKTKNKYELPNYKFNFIKSWDELLVSSNFNDRYDLVFIDSSPWDSRIKALEIFKSISKTIIIHDFDYFNKGVCEDIFSISSGSFYEKYTKNLKGVVYKEKLPPTLVLKNDNF